MRRGLLSSSYCHLTVWHKMMLLNVVAIIWGSQHAVMKGLVGSATPATVNAVRFVLACMSTIWWLPCSRKGKEGPVVLHGLKLGFLNFLGFAAYSTGLKYTTASRSGFLLYLNVKIVPILAFLVLGRRLSGTAWAMAAMAVIGTLLLCNDGTPPNIGDLWSLTAAFTSACYILQLEYSSSICNANSLNGIS